MGGRIAVVQQRVVIFIDFKVAYFQIEIVNFNGNRNSDKNKNMKSNRNSIRSRRNSIRVSAIEFKMKFQRFSELKKFA